ncbi:MAG: hypothetical protein QOG93_2119 [Gaiellaceae bacterium]|nr:hypothetical protein [Gaiellaceae bacterium]
MIELRRGPRVFPRGGGGGKRKHEDHQAHADSLKSQADEVLAEQLKRPTTWGIDPKLILVLTLNRRVPSETWRDADLLELDAATVGAVVAFSSDPQLAGFLERLAKHRAAKETKKGSLFAADLFDAIEGIRRYGPDDRVSARLAEHLASCSEAAVALDVELWHPGDDVALADAWRTDVERAITEAKGLIVDHYVDHARGIVLLRVRARPEVVPLIAQIDEIATMDVVPQAPPVLTSALDASLDEIPEAQAPRDDAPLVAIVDSGINASHPLLVKSVYEATTLLPDLADGADDHGHGTAVAGVLLNGPSEDFLLSGVLTRPFGRLLSIRVLDKDNRFPQGVLFENALAAAVRYAGGLGAGVINLSIGDPANPLVRRRATPVASVIDALARELDVVIIVPTGNSHPTDYTSNDAQGASEYVARASRSAVTALLDPAPSALAITVGGVGQSVGLPKVGEIVLGGDEQPSAVTRRGPGVARAVKPELVGPSGTMAWSPSLGFVERPRQLARILCSNDPAEIFRHDIGTSFAAPSVARVATAVRSENPTIKSAALTRALVLQSASPITLDPRTLHTGTKAEIAREQRHLVGHGAPRLASAIGSLDRRVVFVAEGTLPVDFVVLYSVPLPASFFATGGMRRITLGLAFDPLTRYKRLDYLGSRLYPYLFHGATVDGISKALLQADDASLKADSLRSLKKFRLDLDPSAPASSDSANIFGVWERHTKMDSSRGDSAVLAIRSSRRWAPSNTQDRFGVALAIEQEGVTVNLHAELAARVTVPVEISLTT